MTRNYGTNRVMEPQHVLPTSAWRLDNSRNIAPEEIRVDIKRIHIEQTSFKQICLEAADNDQRIKQKIMDIVIRRGKLHLSLIHISICNRRCPGGSAFSDRLAGRRYRSCHVSGAEDHSGYCPGRHDPSGGGKDKRHRFCGEDG